MRSWGYHSGGVRGGGRGRERERGREGGRKGGRDRGSDKDNYIVHASINAQSQVLSLGCWTVGT